LKIGKFADEPNTTPFGLNESSPFTLVNLGDVSGLTGAQIETATAGVSVLQRPEDGAWDTINHNRYYFVTTANTTATRTIGDQIRAGGMSDQACDVCVDGRLDHGAVRVRPDIVGQLAE
jgi:hypothetical protein